MDCAGIFWVSISICGWNKREERQYSRLVFFSLWILFMSQHFPLELGVTAAALLRVADYSFASF